jgi:hypothetical protein
MRVRDMMAETGRVWLKSEFGPINDRWPCVSYSKRSVGKKFRTEFEAGRDMLIYVGTTSSFILAPTCEPRIWCRRKCGRKPRGNSGADGNTRFR